MSESVRDVFQISVIPVIPASQAIPVIPVSQVIPVIPVSQVIPVIPVGQVIPVSPVSPVSLAHLWVNFLSYFLPFCGYDECPINYLLSANKISCPWSV